ncbi:MAG TPA: HAD-IA family hydrolase [Paracoccaceae bacterium]|nr:HAD-IA family hydrolase [Paracoccaceae bacterium]
MTGGPLRLIIFDVDGTLVDSQASIVAAMAHAFASEGLPLPERAAILGVVGLSLEVAMPRLVPAQTADTHARLVQAYKGAFMQDRTAQGARHAPLYPYARATLDQLAATPENILGLATGKSQRGLDALLESHGLTSLFTTRQVADHHPSKPHPSMLLAALSETGIAAQDAVMIGDTSFDMEMAQAAGIAGIGVSWGYHPPAALTLARTVIGDFRDLPACLDQLWGSR